MDVATRLVRLVETFDDLGCDALVVSHLTNVRYLTGFTGSAALLLVTHGGTLFVTDGRYRDRSAEELAAAGVDAEIRIVAAEPDAVVAEAAAAAGARRIALEAAHVSWSAQRRWAGELVGDLDLIPADGAVERLRLLKDAGEVARIRAACAIADAALGNVRPQLLERPTESAFAAALDAEMRALGAADVSFETIVAAGPNGAKPHHTPSDRVIVEGDLVVIDFGALVDGYHSDMTRTVAVGEVGEERMRMLDVVLEAQAAGVSAVHAGVDAAVVDQACRQVIDDAGWGEAFLHSTGHGVGLDIHEEPRVGARSTATLDADQVVTVEPGVYLSGLGGVRIEDTVLVVEGGCDRLTLAPKDPILA
ncbi:MAG: aminopeptidase P family protein [Actinobacteria bacterium]|nr:aminopeptidase P family protein [Actinomycetota bacterium]